jgi:hypothetical protein
MFGVVYLTENILNHKIYIGSDTKNSGNGDPNYLGSGVLLLKAIEKYGRENFRKKILCTCLSLEDLKEKETFYIRKFSSNKREIGYNISDGYWGGNTLSEHPEIKAIREKISTASKKASSLVSAKRKEYFLNETEEQKEIRIHNLKEGMKKADKTFLSDPQYKINLSNGIKKSEKFKDYQRRKIGVSRGKYNLNKENSEKKRLDSLNELEKKEHRKELIEKLQIDSSTFYCYLRVYLHVEGKKVITSLNEYLSFVESKIFTGEFNLVEAKEEYLRLGLDLQNLGKSTTVIKSLYSFKVFGRFPGKIIEASKKF